MPLRHSPQQQSATVSSDPTFSFTPKIDDSDTPPERSGRRNSNVRAKRRREQDDEIKDLKTEMRELFSKLSTSAEQQFQVIKQQNIDLQESLQFMSDKYDDILIKVQQIEEERVEFKHKIEFLENKIESFERKFKSTGLEIRNLPRTSDNIKIPESKQDMCILVKSLAKAVGETLLDDQIRDTYRINSSKEQNKPLIVELNSILVKEKMLTAIKSFNSDKPKGEKLNTTHLNVTGPPRPVYVAETLTSKTQKLFLSARELSKVTGYAFCWTSKGVVYMRKAPGLPQLRINSEADLQKIKNVI